MVAYKRACAVLVILSSVVPFAEQVPPQRPQAATGTPRKVPLDEVSAVEVPSLPAESIVMPALCDPNGGILFRLAMPDTGVEDPISVSRDGKTVAHFGRDKINDIPRPVPISMFLGGSDIYVLTRGSIQLNSETKWRAPTGEVETHQASKSSPFVAHFKGDGTYAGAIPLDLSFKPLQLGVFENGDFLVAGADEWTSEPRVAIVGSNGQLRRLIELKGDVHAREEPAESGKGKEKDLTASSQPKSGQASQESLRRVVFTSQIAKDGPNLLLFRPANGPVFSISPAGEVRVHKLKLKGAYRLFTIKATRGVWVVEFIYDLPDGTGQEFITYAFDPESGAPLREYFFPRDLGFGLACVDGDEFTFITANDEAKTIKLLTLGPASMPKLD